MFQDLQPSPDERPEPRRHSRSGGQAVTLADEAYRQGFTLPGLPPALAGRIQEETKAGVIRNTNPLDLGTVFNDLFFLEVAETALKEPTVDGLVFFYDYPYDKPGTYDIIAGLERLSHAYEKPVVLCMVPDKVDWFALNTFRPSRGFRNRGAPSTPFAIPWPITGRRPAGAGPEPH